MSDPVTTDPEVRAQRAEEALAGALRERNELWAQLQSRTAEDRRVEHLERVVEAMQSSVSWRITAPLRTVKRVGGPAAALRKLLARLGKR